MGLKDMLDEQIAGVQSDMPSAASLGFYTHAQRHIPAEEAYMSMEVCAHVQVEILDSQGGCHSSFPYYPAEFGHSSNLELQKEIAEHLKVRGIAYVERSIVMFQRLGSGMSQRIN